MVDFDPTRSTTVWVGNTDGELRSVQLDEPKQDMTGIRGVSGTRMLFLPWHRVHHYEQEIVEPLRAVE